MSDQSSNRPLTGKAVTYKSLGGYEVIELVERTVRAPTAGEVRIEVKAAAVNPTDILLRDPGYGNRDAEYGNLTSNIVPTCRREGDGGSHATAPRRRRTAATHRGARCLGRSDTRGRFFGRGFYPADERADCAQRAGTCCAEEGTDLSRERWRWASGSIRDRGRETAGNKGHRRRPTSRWRAGAQIQA